MAKFNVPDRKYCDGPKKMMSMRLPERLIRELNGLADLKGWTVTDLVCTVLDQYIQYEEKQKG